MNREIIYIYIYNSPPSFFSLSLFLQERGTLFFVSCPFNKRLSRFRWRRRRSPLFSLSLLPFLPFLSLLLLLIGHPYSSCCIGDTHHMYWVITHMTFFFLFRTNQVIVLFPPTTLITPLVQCTGIKVWYSILSSFHFVNTLFYISLFFLFEKKR